VGDRDQTGTGACRFPGGWPAASPWPLDNGYLELPVTSAHAVAVEALPPIHKDPFDRILIAQAIFEGITLLTVDPSVAKYPGPIRKV
jgi:hypothetical protein